MAKAILRQEHLPLKKQEHSSMITEADRRIMNIKGDDDALERLCKPLESPKTEGRANFGSEFGMNGWNHQNKAEARLK